MKRKPPLLDTPYPRHRTVSEDEMELWLESIAQEKRTAPVKQPPKPAPRNDITTPVPAKKKRRPDREVHILDRTTFTKIRRGTLAIEATLDLHGATSETAPGLLMRFIGQAQARGVRTILIITGKGSGDKDGVLRRLLPMWLSESPLRQRIIAYDNAGLRHGGSGAWYVRIRKSNGNAGT